MAHLPPAPRSTAIQIAGAGTRSFARNASDVEIILLSGNLDKAALRLQETKKGAKGAL
ncbi:MAG: hypothetical protein AB1440_17200 [Pseudomonadota bacterium]|jgi:hypothetical protein